MAKQVRCEAIVGTMTLTSMSPMRQCRNKATVRESWTTPNGIAKTTLQCETHRQRLSQTLTKSYRAEQL